MVLGMTLPAFADSDGYYCTAPGYLAAEFRKFSTPEIKNPHVLKIVTFAEGLDPRWSGEVSLEDFQTHKLICTPNGGIMIEGVADHGRGLVTYEIKIDFQGLPSIQSVKSDPNYVFQAKDGPPNLALAAPTGTVPLTAASGTQRFQLRFIRGAFRREGDMRLQDRQTLLEQLDEHGTVIRSLVIFHGTDIETLGE